MKVHLAHMSQQQHSLCHSCWFPKVLSDPFAQLHRGQEAKSCRAKGTRLADKTAGDSMQKYILDQESLAYAKWHCVWWTTIQNHLCSGSELSLCQEYSIKTTLTLQEGSCDLVFTLVLFFQEVVTNLKQTQPQVTESAMWLEATGGMRKGGYVSGFGSDTAHFFPEARVHRKSNIGSSTSHSSCEAQIKQLEEQNQVMQQQQQHMHEENRRIRDIDQKMEATLAQFSANIGSLDQDPNKNSSNDDTLPPSTSDDDTLAPSSQD
nr:putative transposase En/Spm [Ipomoea batatas]